MRIANLLAAAAICAGASLATDIYPGGRALAQTEKSDDLRLQVAQAHTAMVRRFAFSRDGRLLSTTDHAGITKIWDFEAGTLLKELSRDADGIELRLLPNGKMLAEMHPDRYEFSIAAITTLAGDTVAHLASVNGTAPKNAFSADGRTVATLTKAGELTVHDLDTGEEMARHDGHYNDFRGMQTIPSPSHEMVLDIEVGDSGAALHISGLTASATAWSARLPGVEAVTGRVDAGFSPSGKYVHATLILDEGTHLHVWDAQTGTPILSRSYPAPRGERSSFRLTTSAVVWSPSEERIAYNLVAKQYVQSEVIDLAKDETIAQIDDRVIEPNFNRTFEKVGSFRPFVTAFLRDEDLVVTTGELLVWNLARGVPVRQLHEVGLKFGGESGLAQTSSFLPREIDDLLVLHASGQIFRYTMPELEFAGPLSQATLPLYHARWTPDGSHILHYAGKSSEYVGISRDYLHALDAKYGHLESGRSLGDIRESVTQSQGESTVHAVAPDLSYAIVSKGDRGAASIFHRQPDGSFVDGNTPLTFPSAYIGNIPIDWIYPDKFRISPSGGRILGRSFRDKLGVFDAVSGEVLSTIDYRQDKAEEAHFGAMAFSGNEQRAYVGYKRYKPPQTSSTSDAFMTTWPVSDGARAEEFQLKGIDYKTEDEECNISSLSAVSNDGSFALGHIRGSHAPCLARLPGGELALELTAAGLQRYARGSKPPGIFPDERGDFSRDGRLVAAVHGSAATVWNTVDGSVQATLRGHLGDLSSIHFSPDGSRLVTSSLDGTLRVWSQDGAELVRFYVFADGEWIAITPDGFFNSSELGAERLNVLKGATLLPMENFFDALFRPDLVYEALAGDPDGRVSATAEELNLGLIWDSGLPPQLTELSTPAGPETDRDKSRIVARLKVGSGGVGRVEIRVNGATQVVENVDAAPGTRPTVAVAHDVFLAPGANQVEVIAYNRDNLIASSPARLDILSSFEQDDKPDLHILAIGVNAYKDGGAPRLNYSINDAESVGRALRQVAEGGGNFENVHLTTVLDDAARQEALDRTFAAISDAVRPEDVFVMFLAGHGVTEEGRYYFLPDNFRYDGPQSFAERGIGQATWQSWLAGVPSQRSLLLYDTCESGSTTRDAGNLELEVTAATTRLARATGRTVLTATSDNALAAEGYKGHGAFTYAVLEGLGLGDADADGQIKVSELARYVETELPKMTQAVFGQRQLPQASVQGVDFSLGRPAIIFAAE